MASLDHEPVLPSPLVTCESLVFDDYDRFWLSPMALQKTVDLINSSSYPMMDIGAATVSADNAPYRARIAEVLFPGEGHESDVHKIFDIGYNYGRVAANYTNQERPDMAQGASSELPGNVSQTLTDALMQDMQGLGSGASLGEGASGVGLFQRLREIEIRHAGSDILGLSLAIAQDHILQQSSLYAHDTNDAIRIQALLYAGALVGGIGYSRANSLRSGLQDVQIVRSVASGGVVPVAQVEFDRNDSLVDLLDYALSNQLHFKFKVRSKPAMLAQHGGAQLGPNAISLPIFYDDEDPNVIEQAMGMDDIVFTETTNTDGPKRIEAYRVRDFMTMSSAGHVIKGFASGDYCVGAYQQDVHPNARQLLEMTSQINPNDAGGISYASDYAMQDRRLGISRKNNLLLLGGMLLSVWDSDAIAYLHGRPESAHPIYSFGSDALILAVWGAVAATKRIRNKNKQ